MFNGKIRFTRLRQIAVFVGFMVILNPLIQVQASERYPTEREMEQLRSQFPSQIRELLSGDFSYYLDDRRSNEEKQRHQQFVDAWSRVNPSVASFLGMWLGYEQTLSIYPASTQGRVCIIEGNEEGFSRFETGTVLENGDIRTSDHRFIIRSGDYLGIAGIYNGEPFVGGEIPLHSPRPLPAPRSTLDTLEDTPRTLENRVRQVLRQFNEAGCTASFPQYSQNIDKID